MDRVLSGESRNISDNLEYDVGESVGSSVDLRRQSWDNTSETTSDNTTETTSSSDMSEIAILVGRLEAARAGPRTHQDPDRDRYTSAEEGTVVDNAADEPELIAVRNAQPDCCHMVRSSVPIWNHLCRKRRL